MLRVTFFFPIFFLEKVIIDAMSLKQSPTPEIVT